MSRGEAAGFLEVPRNSGAAVRPGPVGTRRLPRPPGRRPLARVCRERPSGPWLLRRQEARADGPDREGLHAGADPSRASICGEWPLASKTSSECGISRGGSPRPRPAQPVARVRTADVVASRIASRRTAPGPERDRGHEAGPRERRQRRERGEAEPLAREISIVGVRRQPAVSRGRCVAGASVAVAPPSERRHLLDRGDSPSSEPGDTASTCRRRAILSPVRRRGEDAEPAAQHAGLGRTHFEPPERGGGPMHREPRSSSPAGSGGPPSSASSC